MLIAGLFLFLLALAACLRVRTKEPPMDRDVVDRIRRVADRVRREQLIPYD